MEYKTVGNLKIPQNLSPEKQAIVDEIAKRYAEKNREINKDNLKNMGRIALGSLVSGASFHPILNIPYVGTGLGGAMYDAGQAIVEGDKGSDIAKRAGRGFAIGETVGAVPYVGKGVNKLSGGKIGSALDSAAQKVAANPAVQKAYDVLMTDVKAFNPNKQTAFHGSPYDFNKFSNEAIGTGEGWQAHGHGHYAALKKDIADKNYRGKLAQDYYLNGKKLSENSKEYDIIDAFNDYKTSENPTLEQAKKAYIEQQQRYLDKLKGRTDDSALVQKKYAQDYIDLANSIDLNNLETKTGGQLYKLAIPKDDVLLREGASFAEQPELVQKGLTNIKNNYIKSKGYNSIDEINAELDKLSNQYENIVKNESPYDFYAGTEKAKVQGEISKLENLRRLEETPNIYDYLVNHQNLEPQEVSDLLSKQGIKGISYNGGIDGEARVIFNPNDIDIVRKYYNQPTLKDIYNKFINSGTYAGAMTNP